nr:hypothetical protein CFP56_16123 [Quercus suber]
MPPNAAANAAASASGDAELAATISAAQIELEKERQIVEEPGDGNPSEIQASGDAMRPSYVSSAEPPLPSAAAHTLQLSR